MEQEIELSKKYNLPQDIRVIKHQDWYIVIAPQFSNWIVFKSNTELDFFNLLRTNSIEKSISLFEGSQQEMYNVIMQLEARHFESTTVSKNAYTHMQLYLTNNCNMRCPHCFMSAGEKFEDELNTNEIINLLINFHQSGGTKIILSGGEIGLRQDLEEIINASYELGLETEILSNGTLFPDDLIQRIAPKLSRVQISIDGYSEESNSKIRGRNNFYKALHTIDTFIKQNTRVEVAITPFPSIHLEQESKHYINFGKELVNKYGSRILIKFTTEIFEGRDIDLNKIDKEYYSNTMNHIIEGVYGTTDNKTGFIMSARKQVINDNCAYGALNVSSTGDVYPCAKLHSVKHFANIRTSDWKDIISASNKLKAKSNITELAPCKDCDLLFICGGGCRLDYFKTFENPIELLECESTPQRIECSERNKMLDLLIETNEYIFH